MYQKYRGHAAFFVVYIGEAHPSDAWQLPSNVRDQVVYESPKDLGERSELAELCITRLGIKLPAIVDRFDDATDLAYSGWPDRLYLIDRDGRIAYKSRPGPFGFKPADLEAVLQQLTKNDPDAPDPSGPSSPQP
jgi:Iodothyronine deiodinase